MEEKLWKSEKAELDAVIMVNQKMKKIEKEGNMGGVNSVFSFFSFFLIIWKNKPLACGGPYRKLGLKIIVCFFYSFSYCGYRKNKPLMFGNPM